MTAVRALPLPVGLLLVRNFEWLKWCGLVAMLFDHVQVYGFGQATSLSEFVGGFAFPLFAVSLAAGVVLKHDDALGAVAIRLLVWACVAQIGVVLFRGAVPINVLFTLAFGLVAYLLYQSESLASQFVLSGLIVASVIVEFSVIGVLFVWSMIAAFRSENWFGLLVPFALSFLLVPFNGWQFSPMLAAVAVPLIALIPRDLERVPRIFYWLYVAQWPVLFLMARYLGS